MPTFKYTPDEDVQVHSEGAIRLICKAFQSHEGGIPEWLKNSADAYSREDAPLEKRVVIVAFSYGRRGEKPSISCLDFSGMTSKMIDQNFKQWADPDASRRGSKSISVQGGHGNGGKCYMTQMFDEYASLFSVKKGRGSCYGVAAGSVKFGYVPDADRGKDFLVPDFDDALSEALRAVGCKLAALPKAARAAMQMADGFTLVTGMGPRGYPSKLPVPHLVDALQEHPQMIRTLELCRVVVMVNGKPFNEGRPLQLAEVAPIAGAEVPRIVPVPEELEDPESGEDVSTTKNGALPAGTLVLRTSDTSMRWGKKGRHVINFKTSPDDYIGYSQVLELDVQSPYRDRIYGECVLAALADCKQNERARLARSPLSRAVERFIGAQLQAYAREFESKDRRRYDIEEKSALSRMNDALDHWKNSFLTEFMHGLWGEGEGTGKRTVEHLPSGKPSTIEVSLSHSMAGVGVAFRPSIKFFDASGRQIRSVPYHWVSEDNNVAMVDEDLMVVNTFAPGHTSILAEILTGKLRSNRVPLEVAHVRDISITPPTLELPAGTRSRLEASCRLDKGQSTSGIYLVWTEGNPAVARVSSSGLVFGFAPGETEVLAGDDHCLASRPAAVVVTPGAGRGRGDKSGRGFPRVLISDCDLDPDTKETVIFSREDPPIGQRPSDVDRNIWWVNSAAPFARMYLDDTRGFGYESREWRMYLFERYTDILVQIAFTHGPSEGKLTANDWLLKWGEQVAGIQEAAAASLFDFIASGELPSE